jgi:hypothetical protein
MTQAELRQAVLNPARDAGLELEPGLADLLLRDLGAAEEGYEAGRLPLLAHALQVTWQQRHGHQLTVAGYQASGGISHAVTTTAERIYAQLDGPGQQIARALFLRLVRIGADGDDSRRRIDWPAAHSDAVLDAFTQGRLLTREQDTVTITHEVLLRAWPRLRSWIDEDRAGNLIRQELEEAAAAWERHQRDPALLLRGARLESARAWAESPGLDHQAALSPAALACYVTSLRLHRNARIRRRTLTALLSVLTVAATASAMIAVRQTAAVRDEIKAVTLGALIAEAGDLRATGHRADAAQLDLAAYRLSHRTGPATVGPDLYSGLVADASTVLPLPASLLDAVDVMVSGSAFAGGSSPWRSATASRRSNSGI